METTTFIAAMTKIQKPETTTEWLYELSTRRHPRHSHRTRAKVPARVELIAAAEGKPGLEHEAQPPGQCRLRAGVRLARTWLMLLLTSAPSVNGVSPPPSPTSPPLPPLPPLGPGVVLVQTAAELRAVVDRGENASLYAPEGTHFQLGGNQLLVTSNISLFSTGDGATLDVQAASPQTQSRVAEVSAGGVLELRKLRLINGLVIGGGGAVSVNGGSLLLEDSHISECRSSDGWSRLRRMPTR